MTNKKTRKKTAQRKITAGKKSQMVREPAKRKPAPKKKTASKSPRLKSKAASKSSSSLKNARAAKKRIPRRGERADTEEFVLPATRSRSAGQSGDLQGLSDVEGADSESVDELIEEGNAFEADVVTGVENADAADEREVRTHEVPEDDVPGEYLDEE
jgi:hypothetical protein